MSLLFYWASIFIVYFFTGGTFETVMGGTIHSAAGGTFETVMGGTIHSAAGGTFETVMGGTNNPLPSHLQILPHFSFPIEVQREEMRKIIMIKVILVIFGGGTFAL